MSTLNRLTIELGNLLAKAPGTSFSTNDAAGALGCHQTSVSAGSRQLSELGAINLEVKSGRRGAAMLMTAAQAAAWTERPPVQLRQSKQVEPCKLRFAVWSDGALAIEGLARKQLTLPADDTGRLAEALAALPEGAFEGLCNSPLKPVFTLSINGKDYALNAQQAADLVAYIEQLPARTLRVPRARIGALPGTDHRVHRIETEEDRKAA